MTLSFDLFSTWASASRACLSKSQPRCAMHSLLLLLMYFVHELIVALPAALTCPQTSFVGSIEIELHMAESFLVLLRDAALLLEDVE